MEIKICQNKQEWDNWALERKPTEFLQSWDWGEFQRATGKDVLRLQIVEGGMVRQAHHRVVWQGQGFVHRLGVGLSAAALAKAGMKYLYVPRVEVISNQSLVISERLLLYLKNAGFAFARIESQKDYHISHITYHISSTKNRQPQNTLVLNLKDEDGELLSAMHEKTRYNIRLAEKKGVVIREEKNIETFWRLNLATTARDKFKSHEKEYYNKMLEFDFCHQLTAYYENQPIAAILLIIFGDTATYLHGVSSNEHRNLMAPYLLQWEGIKLGKKLGCERYDFWGVAPPAVVGTSTCFHKLCWQADHSWTGVTRFKAGFGGERRDYPGAVDIVLSGWRYGVYRVGRRSAGF